MATRSTCTTCGGTGTVTTTVYGPNGQPQTLTETCLDCL
jgi:DnaJ-class molecular chaperone